MLSRDGVDQGILPPSCSIAALIERRKRSEVKNEEVKRFCSPLLETFGSETEKRGRAQYEESHLPTLLPET